MKKAFAVFTLLLGLISMFAQSGPTFPYQAVVRNSQNQLIKDSTFAIGVEVYQGVDLKFSETQSVTTNANGQFTMNIGGGTLVSGAMADVADWSVAKFKITYHLSEGDIVSENAVSPVPYALQAANVAESAGLDCADVKTCIADTLTHYTTTTALEQMLQQISVRMDAQEATIDSLRHLVDSLSDLSHGGGSTPSAIFFCDSSTVKDVDQNEYHTVAIGNQCWMKENLRTKTHTYGSVYTNPDIDSVIYGRYYDWEAIMQVADANSSDFTPTGIHQGICPTGWHVPSQAEWNTLISYVNSETGYKCDGNNDYIANALSSDTGWESPDGCCAGDNSFTLNKTGFSAVPSGYKFFQTDSYIGNGWITFIGSSTQSNSQSVRILYLRNDDPNTNTANSSLKIDGVSVRCLRDAGIVGNASSNESGIGSGNTPSTPATMSCEDVIECMGDTLGRLNARITSQGAEIETLIGTVASQDETIDSLAKLVASQDSAINSLSNQMIPFNCGTSEVKDVDNNTYNTVQIGNQCWMAQNLRTKTHQYGNVWTKSDADSAIYGRYYDWAAVMQGESGSTVQGICPAGWHVPSDADWDTLTTYVSSVEAYKCNSSIASALSDSTGWKSSSICCAGDNSSATINITGFAAVPAGSFTDGFGGFGYDAYFWSATEYNNQMALCQSLHSLATGVSSYEDYKSHCYSVRCVRNAGIVGNAGSNESGIGSGGSHSAPDGGDNDCCSELRARLDSLENVIDSLANVINNGKVADGQPCPGVATVSDADGNTYNTVKIGSQCWMKENLRKRPTIGNSWNPGGDEGNVAANGLLYDWTAVMQVADANNTLVAVQDKHQGICPNGWHVPSQAEWETLSHYTFDNYRCTDCEEIDPIWQSDLAYCVAKALCSAAWNDGGSSCNANSNAIGKNVTGFSILPAGACFSETPGSFGAHAYFWSATQRDEIAVNSWSLGSLASSFDLYSDNKSVGLSVRCIRN